MNYTGFGTDPNLIYSFRRGGGDYERFLYPAGSEFTGLRQSLVYQQAGGESRARMEKAVEMGLPPLTDIRKIQKAGYDPSTQRPIYSAPRPQPWGTWGALSGPMAAEGTPVVGGYRKSGGPQPAQKPASGISGTPFAERTEYPVLGGGVRSAGPSPSLVGSLTGFGGIPRFPFANY